MGGHDLEASINLKEKHLMSVPNSKGEIPGEISSKSDQTRMSVAF